MIKLVPPLVTVTVRRGPDGLWPLQTGISSFAPDDAKYSMSGYGVLQERPKYPEVALHLRVEQHER